MPTRCTRRRAIPGWPTASTSAASFPTRTCCSFYNACDLFVFPSFYEGFGLPALEAMACGRAVVCSHTSALPEVVDGAAILFDPYAVDEIVRALADLLLDAELRARMERLGLQRAAHFSWQKTAQRTLEVFHDVLEKSRPTERRIFSDHSSSMTSFRRIVLLALVCAPLIFAAAQLTGFPFQNETLHYSINWPSGISLGDATMTAHKADGGGWDFEMSIDAEIPVVPISDSYKSLRCRHGSLLVDVAARDQPRRARSQREDHVRPEGDQATRAARWFRPAAARASSPFPPARAMR